MIGLVLLWCSLAFGTGLQLEEVLQDMELRVPSLRVASAKVEEGRAKALGKRGAFDPKLKGNGGVYAQDYPRQMAEASVAVDSLWGPSVAAGWRVGAGQFPTYDRRGTGEGGELFVRVGVPVLDGLGRSEGRTALQIAEEGVASTVADELDKLRMARQKATAAWSKWVAAGERWRIQKEIVAQTSTRQRALDRQVAEGARARIDQLDNLRGLRQREAELAAAEGALTQAAAALSLWYRDDQGRPLVPGSERLPKWAVPAIGPEGAPGTASVLAVQRADTQRFDAQVRAAEIQVRRSRNAVLPDLSIVAQGTRPQDVNLPTELYAGAKLEVSMLLRKERGARLAAEAAAVQAREQRREGVDAARAEIFASRAAVQFAWSQLQATVEAEQHAAEVVRLERRRFALGGGDLFKLLARESNLVKAQQTQVKAVFTYQMALAERDLAEGLR